jgi:hypothetical protein
MKLYIVEIGNKINRYKYLSDKLSVYELNRNKDLSPYKINNNDYNAILNGGSILYRQKEFDIWIIDIENQYQNQIQSKSIVGGIIKQLKLDIKLENILNK